MSLVTRFEQYFVAYTRLLIRGRWVVLIASLMAAIALGSGVRHLGFSNDFRVFFGPDNPQLMALDDMEATYSKTENVMFAVSTKQGDGFDRRVLQAVEEITAAGWLLPFANRVNSVTNFQNTVAVGDDLFVGDLFPDPSTMTDAELAHAKDIAIHEPALRRLLVADDGGMVAVSVNVHVPGKDSEEIPMLVAEARALRDRVLEKYPELDIYMTGGVMINNAFPEASKSDIKNLVPFVYLCMSVMMWLMLRSLGATIATLIVIGLSSLTGMGVAASLGIQISPPAAVAPLIIMTLAIADCVHILVSMFFNMREGESRHEALVDAMRQNFMPIFLTSITTAVGFLSLNFSDAPPMHDLGNITAIGVMAAYVYSITFLPALIAILPIRAPAAKSGLAGSMNWLSDLVVRRQRVVLIVTITISVLLLAAIPLNQANDQFHEFFGKDIEFRSDTDQVIERMSGFYPIYFNLDTKIPGGVTNPEYLKKLDEFEAFWQQFPELETVATFSALMKRLNRSMHGDDPDWYRIPESSELAAQYLLLYELSLPYGLDLTNTVNMNKSGTRYMVLFDNISSQQTRQFAQAGEQWLQDNAPEIFNYGTGTPVMFSYISERNINSMFKGMFFAFLGISLMLIFALRSFKIGLLSVVPNLLPIGVAFGIWGLIDGQINFTMASVMGMTMGIVVDDTIHFLSKYLRGRREKGYSAEESVRYALRTVGSAIVVTSLVLMAGFMINASSSFLPNAGNAQLTTLAIMSALFADLLLLPALLLWLDRRDYAQSSQ